MLRRVAFNPESPLIVRRAFDGHRIGDNFDSGRCNIRRVGQLFRTGYIAHPGEAWEPVKASHYAPVLPVTVDVAPEPTVEVVEQVTVPEVDSLVAYTNTGAGWYNVEVAGVVVNDKKLKGLEAAQAWAVEQGYAEPA